MCTMLNGIIFSFHTDQEMRFDDVLHIWHYSKSLNQIRSIRKGLERVILMKCNTRRATHQRIHINLCVFPICNMGASKNSFSVLTV